MGRDGRYLGTVVIGGPPVKPDFSTHDRLANARASRYAGNLHP
jgi:hypothetical protein